MEPVQGMGYARGGTLRYLDAVPPPAGFDLGATALRFQMDSMATIEGAFVMSDQTLFLARISPVVDGIIRMEATTPFGSGPSAPIPEPVPDPVPDPDSKLPEQPTPSLQEDITILTKYVSSYYPRIVIRFGIFHSDRGGRMFTITRKLLITLEDIS